MQENENQTEQTNLSETQTQTFMQAEREESQSIAQHDGEESIQNPFIRAEENEEYKKMEREFKEYRTKKVLSKIDGLSVDSLTVSEIKEDFRRTATAKAKSVVLPYLVQTAKRELPEHVKIETLINFPYAGGNRKAVMTEIKQAVRAKVRVGVAISLCSFASGNRKHLDREIKSLKKFSSKTAVSPIFAPIKLKKDQLARLANTVKNYKFDNVKFVGDGGECEVERLADAVKIFYDILGEQCTVDVIGKISTAEDVETLFSAGADRLITTDYATLSRQRLDNITF